MADQEKNNNKNNLSVLKVHFLSLRSVFYNLWELKFYLNLMIWLQNGPEDYIVQFRWIQSILRKMLQNTEKVKLLIIPITDLSF